MSTQAQTHRFAGQAHSPLQINNVKVIKRDNLIELMYLLQASLDVKKHIQSLYELLNQDCGIGFLQYQHTDLRIDLKHGTQSANVLHYELVLNDQASGHLTFGKMSAFSKSDIDLIEGYISFAVYPIRNALDYKVALIMAQQDPLTGIANRAALLPAMKREIDLSRRHNLPMVVLTLDVDHFKKVNDSYGHPAGDRVLKEIANLLTHTVRESDLIFRIGGEEFVAILRNTNRDGGLVLAERIREKIEDSTIHYKAHDIQVTTSIGLSEYVSPDTETVLLEKSDRALYRAKSRGRNCVSF